MDNNKFYNQVAVDELSEYVLKEYSSYGDFLKTIWGDPKAFDFNQKFGIWLMNKFPPELHQLFEPLELIFLILEEQTPAWHLQQLDIYEEILKEQLEQQNNTTQMMAFLTRVKVGIRTPALKILTGSHTSVYTHLELTILNTLHSVQFEDRDRLKELEDHALLAIDTHLQQPAVEHWEKAMFQLPILGFLWHQDKAIDYLDKCLQLSFFERTLKDHYPILLRHLGLYYRKAVLQLCREGKWGELLRVKYHNLGWSAKLFDNSINALSLEEYRGELVRQEQIEVNRQMHNYNVSEAADDIDALADLI